MKIRSDSLKSVVLAASAVLAVSVILATAGAAVAAPVPSVSICHFPPGNPDNVQSIIVGASSVAKHIEEHNDAVCTEGNSDCCFGGDDPSVCTNLDTDVNNCGACGEACGAGLECAMGECCGTLHCAGAPVCGNSGPLGQCLASVTTEGDCFCAEVSFCSNVSPCSSSDECAEGTACVDNCGCGRPVCLPACASGTAAPSLQAPAGGPTSAGY